MILMSRYFYGWYMAARAWRMARRKKHGAGRAPLYIAWRMAMAYRWLVDGQMRKGKPPRYIRAGMQ